MSKKISGFRRVLPQVIATSIKTLIMVDISCIFGISIAMVPALTGIRNEPNRNEFLSITSEEASWCGSIAFIALPIGCMFSGFVTEPYGRKRSMQLVNIPFALGWFILYQATEKWHLFAAALIHGLAYGLVEAPVVSFISEISEPSMRGTLIAFSNLGLSVGSICVLIFNMYMPWRSICLVCFTLPIISIIALYFVPETPQWLLSKNRTKDAEKSLCWLRGWVPAEMVAQEFKELQQNIEQSKSCTLCIKQNLKCLHPMPSLREKLTGLKRKSIFKPFILLLIMFTVSQFNGIYAMRPFIVQIFKAYEAPIPLDQAAVLLGVTDTCGQVLFLCLVRLTGKRRLYLFTGTGIFLITLVISIYGYIVLPTGFTSFDHQNQSFHLENNNLAYIPLVCLYLWCLMSSAGFLGMPWIMLSELYAFKIRSILSGATAAANYTIGFFSRKTYYNLETAFSLAGATTFYCMVCGAGTIIMYFLLPETEGRTLEDIELHFADNSKPLTDRIIAKKVPDHTNNVTNSQNFLMHIENGIDKHCASTRSGDAMERFGVDNKGFEVESTII